jgi:iron(III) transport system substrate-binding protein
MHLEAHSPRRRAVWLRSIIGAAVLAAATVIVGVGVTTLATATHQPTLVVYSSEGYGGTVVEAFRLATGIRVRLVTDTSTFLISHIHKHGKVPACGVLWVDGATNFATLDKEGLLARGLKTSASLNSLGAGVEPKDKSYLPTGVTLADALVYTANVVSSPPTQWSQLTSSAWKGAVGITNPRHDPSTYPFLAGILYKLGGNKSLSDGEKYFDELHANHLKVYTTVADTLQALTGKHIKLALLQSDAAIGEALRHKDLRVTYLPPATPLASAIGISAHASRADQTDAMEFVNFVLSPAGQSAMLLSTKYGASQFYPVVSGTTPPPTIPSITAITTRAITPYVWGPRQRVVDAWFNARIARSTTRADGRKSASKRK